MVNIHTFYIFLIKDNKIRKCSKNSEKKSILKHVFYEEPTFKRCCYFTLSPLKKYKKYGYLPLDPLTKKSKKYGIWPLPPLIKKIQKVWIFPFALPPTHNAFKSVKINIKPSSLPVKVSPSY